MAVLTPLQTLTRYKRWADALMIDDVAAAPAGEALRERATRWQNMVRTLNHVHVVDDLFRCHLLGQAHSYTYRNTDITPPLDALRQAMLALDDWYVDYANALSVEAQAELVPFRFLDGGNGAMTRGDMLLHVVNHATYHRGLVSDMLYQAGCVPSTNDLPVFLAG